MSSNFEWQKYQSNERVKARLQEANTHRQAKEGNNEDVRPIRLSLMISALLGVIVLFFILNGCAPAAQANESVKSAVREVPVMTMAERIQFQDSRDESYRYEVGTADFEKAAPMTMAERIGFHDSVLDKNQ